jgi:hypothetical protein
MTQQAAEDGGRYKPIHPNAVSRILYSSWHLPPNDESQRGCNEDILFDQTKYPHT